MITKMTKIKGELSWTCQRTNSRYFYFVCKILSPSPLPFDGKTRWGWGLWIQCFEKHYLTPSFPH